MPVVQLSRRETFSASHRLLSPHLNEAENQAAFGKCYHASGHGHNYELEVSIRGEVNPRTGLVMNLTVLKEVIHEHVIAKVDHRHLNLDVPEFATLNPTAENMAVVIWKWLHPHLGELLYEVRLRETENNVSIYRGE